MKRFFVILLLVAAFAACTPIQEQIKVNDCTLAGLDNLSLEQKQIQVSGSLMLDAENASCSDITLKAFGAELFNRSGKRVATLVLDTHKGEKKPVLHHKSGEQIIIPLKVGFDNPLSAIALAAMGLEDYATKGYTVDYDCTVCAGCFPKRLKGSKVPVEELLKMLER